ncbi:hypothetical protein JW916_12745, partial [Candidatus Sumerlaeota bacterium]|nr:hypothetical protein [Candidatus Sumerlaeota bacterium]
MLFLGSLVLSLAASSVAAAADGYAGANGGTTGGAGGPTVTVDNAADFIYYVEDTDQDPYIIQVSGNIVLPSTNVRVRGNKTVIGLAGSHIAGNLKCYGAEESNNIFQNLDMDNYSKVGDGDCITIDGVEHVWIDHCTFTDGGDGNVDIKNGAEWVTVSWCIFQYTYNSGHNFSNLIGHSDSNGDTDRGKLHVTFHHCLWGNLAHERMPRVRFGTIHSYNNYFHCPGNNYCIRVALESQVLLENSYFEDIDQPWEYYTKSGQIPGKIRAVNCIFDNVTGLIAGEDTVSTPSYSYTLDETADVPAIVMAGAGAGNTGDPGDTTPPSPDPMTWDTPPYALGDSSISMTASTAADSWTVQYYFTNRTVSGHDSGWQFGASYVDTGLDPLTTYTYTVKARDTSPNQNETGESTAQSARTDTADATPPSPNPMTWATLPHTLGPTSIAMTATTASDPSGVEYYFTNQTVLGHDSGWRDEATYEDAGLDPQTQYTYTVKARDKSANRNETTASAAQSATTMSDLPGAHWKLDESSGATAHDASGHGNDGTLENMSD